ncbi:unnamed protein product [Larinioides sclopetarius]|uniref:Uncharacterized protein n=1 Tax=Larinioides sclopetarius TaxID=280406 RepID=A0AAV1YYM7_9ARAC
MNFVILPHCNQQGMCQLEGKCNLSLSSVLKKKDMSDRFCGPQGLEHQPITSTPVQKKLPGQEPCFKESAS